MPVTRTNRKRWVALCPYCVPSWTSLVHPNAAHAAVELRDHLTDRHGVAPAAASRESGLNQKGQDMGVKQANPELPPQEGGVKLGDYAGKLVVFDNAVEAKDESSFGKRDTVHATLWVFDPDQTIEEEGIEEKVTRLPDGWVSLGETIVWFQTVGKQIMEALPDQLGGMLTKGTARNANEWAIVPVPAKAKNLVAALAKWDPSF